MLQLKSFVDQYRSGAQGCQMDADAAKALADDIDALLADLESAYTLSRMRRWPLVQAQLERTQNRMNDG